MNRSKTFLFSFKDSSNTQNFTVKDSSASSSSFVHVFYYVQVFYVNSYYFRRFPSKPSKYRFPSSPCWENGWLCVSACFQMCLLHSAFYEKKMVQQNCSIHKQPTSRVPVYGRASCKLQQQSSAVGLLLCCLFEAFAFKRWKIFYFFVDCFWFFFQHLDGAVFQ